MRVALSALLLCAGCAAALAQTTVPKGVDHPGSACPPGTTRDAIDTVLLPKFCGTPSLLAPRRREARSEIFLGS